MNGALASGESGSAAPSGKAQRVYSHCSVAIQFKALTQQADSSGATLELTVPKPSVALNDFLFGVMMFPRTQPKPDENQISTPGGWFKLDQTLHAARYWRVAGTTDYSNTWSCSLDPPPGCLFGAIVVYSGVNPTSPMAGQSHQPTCPDCNDGACNGDNGNVTSTCACPGDPDCDCLTEIPAVGVNVSWNLGQYLLATYFCHDAGGPIELPTVNGRLMNRRLRRAIPNHNPEQPGIAVVHGDLGATDLSAGPTGKLCATPTNPAAYGHGVADLTVLKPA
jgi:hypothetical protein